MVNSSKRFIGKGISGEKIGIESQAMHASVVFGCSHNAAYMASMGKLSPIVVHRRLGNVERVAFIRKLRMRKQGKLVINAKENAASGITQGVGFGGVD